MTKDKKPREQLTNYTPTTAHRVATSTHLPSAILGYARREQQTAVVALPPGVVRVFAVCDEI